MAGHDRNDAEQRQITLRLPRWLEKTCGEKAATPLDEEGRMRFVIELARQAVETRSGGPFGAAVFAGNGLLVAAGINLVVPAACSIWHAEMVAIALAQARLGRYDLGAGGQCVYELVSSSEPCAMCFGAIPWTGLKRLICGARASDAEALGFDEGPKPDDWLDALRRRGIAVHRDVLRAEAVAVLQRYRASGGEIYNPRNAAIEG